MTKGTSASAADPTIVRGPALSATSDAPTPQETPPLSEERVPDTQHAGDSTKVAEPAAETDEHGKPIEAKPEGEPKPPEIQNFDDLPPWAKREITKSRNRERAAKQAAAESNANLAKALAALEAANGERAAATIKAADAADPKPVREKFDTPEAYDSALVEWSARRASREATAKLETERAKEKTDAEKQRAETERTELSRAFEARKTAFVKDHPDYEEIVERDDLPISMPMAHAILNSDDGPAVAYYLGQNPDEAERISKLNPINTVYEMGKISTRLAQKPNQSTKPAPINPLRSGNTAAVRKSPNEESMEEYAARRTPEILAQRKPFLGNGVARAARP